MSEGLIMAYVERESAENRGGVPVQRPSPPSVEADKPVDAGAVLVTPVGLRMTSELSLDRWISAGRRIAEVASSSSWCLGDWVNYGETRYADRYRDVVEAVGLDYQTIRNYAWVARKIEIRRRRPALSFQHHAEVASMPSDRQDYWLAKAQAGSWSRNRLRLEIRQARTGEQMVLEKIALPRLSADQARVERWRQAAEHSSSTLQEWIVECLDRQAAMLLESRVRSGRGPR
jgi:hypothetical protein